MGYQSSLTRRFRLGFTTLEDTNRTQIQEAPGDTGREQGARACNTNSEVSRNSFVEAQTKAGFSGGERGKQKVL